MKNNRRWVRGVLGAALAVPTSLAAWGVWADPFVCYRAPRFAFEAPDEQTLQGLRAGGRMKRRNA